MRRLKWCKELKEVLKVHSEVLRWYEVHDIILLFLFFQYDMNAALLFLICLGLLPSPPFTSLSWGVNPLLHLPPGDLASPPASANRMRRPGGSTETRRRRRRRPAAMCFSLSAAEISADPFAQEGTSI